MSLFDIAGVVKHDVQHDPRACETGADSPIVQAGPTENVEVANAIHVSRVEMTCVWIYKVVVESHLIPGRYKINIDIVRNLEVTVETQKTRKRAIDRVVESNSIDRVIALVAQEVLIVG